MGKGSILCVEDEEGVLQVATETLNRLGYEVIARSNPVEALRIFKQQADDISLVIAEIVMPGITGNALAKEVHAISPGTPVILITANPELITTRLTEEAMEIGVKRILAKPFTRADLRGAITEALRKTE